MCCIISLKGHKKGVAFMDNYNDFDWLNSELLPGEMVLWRGKPDDKKLLSPQDVFLLPFSILWGGFALFWEFLALTSDGPGVFPLFGLPFVGVGLYLLFGRFVHKKYILKNTYYVITNKRAIFYNKGKITSCDYQQEPTISLKLCKNGSGTITFGNSYKSLNSNSGGFLLENFTATENQFLNIPDAQNVHRIINQQKMTNN